MTDNIAMTRIVRRSVTEEVRLRLIQLIRTDLEPGAKLPSERELMAYLGVGRSSIREASRWTPQGLRILSRSSGFPDRHTHRKGPYP